MNNEIEELKKDVGYYRKKAVFHAGLVNDIIDIFAEYIGYGGTAYIVKNIVDNNTDEHMKNTAKYIMYWVEKANIIDDPKYDEYNDYKEEVEWNMNAILIQYIQDYFDYSRSEAIQYIQTTDKTAINNIIDYYAGQVSKSFYED